MSFVDSTLKIKHFRHLMKVSCDYESETIEHEVSKKIIYDCLLDYGQGKAFIEERGGRLIADVYWMRDQGPNVAFEVQATNYDISKYEEKIKSYVFKNILVVYVFIGDNFRNEVKSHIYSLKEIEKRIFIKGSYRDSVIGCYLNSDRIKVPSFSSKFAKGRDEFCTDRFIMEHRWTKDYSINNFISIVDNHKMTQSFMPLCNHEETTLERSDGKIVRYKVVCAVCGKFFKWLPNKEALNMGLDL